MAVVPALYVLSDFSNAETYNSGGAFLNGFCDRLPSFGVAIKCSYAYRWYPNKADACRRRLIHVLQCLPEHEAGQILQNFQSRKADIDAYLECAARHAAHREILLS